MLGLYSAFFIINISFSLARLLHIDQSVQNLLWELAIPKATVAEVAQVADRLLERGKKTCLLFLEAL